MRRHAFTLLEITVALAIGMLILSTAYAGFRVSVQTVTVCNRLSLENRLLTAGVLRAVDEVDFWTAMDDAAHAPLRTTPSKPISADTGGYDPNGNDSQALPQPFTAFAASWHEGLNQVPAAANRFDPDWRPDDPRTWYRGDGFLVLPHRPGANDQPENSIWGNYGLFSGLERTVRHRGETATVGAFAGEFPADTYTWTACQHKGLKYALGFYGWWDYLPANAVLDWYDRDASGHAIRTFELRRRYEPRDHRVGSIGQFSSGVTGYWTTVSERPMTRSSYLWEQMMCISAPRPGEAAIPLLRLNRWVPGHRDFNAESESPINSMLENLSRPQDLVAARPSDWPRCTAEVRRYRVFARTSNDCHVRMFDPGTGRMVEIDFRSIGSTLRGARLQRSPAAGGPALAVVATLDG